MIKVLLFRIRNFFTKPNPKPKHYVHLIHKFEDDRYLCVIDGRIYSITAEQYENYLKHEI